MTTLTKTKTPTEGRKPFAGEAVQGTNFEMAYISHRASKEIRVLIGITDKDGRQIAIPMDADDLEQVCKVMTEMVRKIRSGELIEP